MPLQFMARALYESSRLDRQLQVFDGFAAAEARDRQDWLRMTPKKRLEIVELLRQMNHAGYDPASRGLPRLYTVAQSEAR